MFCSGEEAGPTGTCLVRKPQEIIRALPTFSKKKKKSVLLEVEGGANHATHSVTRRATRSNIAGKIPYAPRPNGTAWLLCSHQASSVPFSEECKPPAGSCAWVHPCLNCARCSLAHLKHARDLTPQLCGNCAQSPRNVLGQGLRVSSLLVWE